MPINAAGASNSLSQRGDRSIFENGSADHLLLFQLLRSFSNTLQFTGKPFKSVMPVALYLPWRKMLYSQS
jgi:hypothetical protein